MSIDLGVVGVGGFGYLQTRVAAELEGVRIVGGADVSPAARRLFEEEFDAPAYAEHAALLAEHADELDAVTIVTPHTLHYPQAKDCLERGVHVLVEKPMVTDVGHAVDLVETAEERDLILEVGYQRHVHPAFAEIRRIIGQGRIGEVHAVNCHLGQDWIEPHRDTWRADPELSGGGQLYDTGSHLLDALVWTTDGKPERVSAEIEFETPRIDVNSALALRLDCGGRRVTASVAVSGDGVDIVPSEGYFYWGTEGRLTYFDDRIAVAEKGAATYSTEITGETDFETLTRRKLENFLAAVEGTGSQRVSGRFGLQVTALTEAAYRSAERGEAVAISKLIQDAAAARQ